MLMGMDSPFQNMKGLVELDLVDYLEEEIVNGKIRVVDCLGIESCKV